MRGMVGVIVAAAAFGWTTPARASEVSGKISLAGAQKYELCVGYVGKGSDGKEISNLSGVTFATNYGPTRVQCDTFKPRTSSMAWDPKTGCTFKHTNLPPGR